MKEIFGYKITDKAIEIIEHDYEINIEQVLKERIDEIIDDVKMGYTSLEFIVEDYDKGGIVCANEDMNAICYICDFTGFIGDRTFCEVPEFNIYVAENKDDGKNYIEGDIGDASNFLCYFLGEGKEFCKNIRKLVWVRDDDVLKNALEEILNQLDDEEEDDDYICLEGCNIWHCTIEQAFRANEEYKNSTLEEVGDFAGEIIYKVDDRLYYVTDSSYYLNSEYYYALNEVSSKCYKNFGYIKPEK